MRVKNYPKQRLTIKDKRKVEPNPEDLSRIERERETTEAVKRRFSPPAPATDFAVPVASGPAHDVISWARDNGLPLIVTTPATDVLHTQVDLSGPAALVVGSEKHGVDDQMLAAADQLIRIPMAGVVNSLNVSVASGVCLYEALRQRS